ncbi:DNA polymerase III subunit epsilon [Corynebacterium sanguinis]|uniref:DNA polymerase III subunit epsilon n=1 Tax=Corynebacterium sanguinis TaxID=2594913 RepID=A0A838WZI3_9CORY|nr:DNA polymerase III subunit epsilon [Corynebacterium sanguinis]MBA4504271.1 DNA polymerase III subunit epsilon [Corynebacterium sanguinis]MCT1412656.1 DNA polymerase III subunit epsilon [Corynebacterium sanguinis]MCT1464652.1 DNA polymerase III subunit epsilon [Corynebacterium sanguinis]MCT1499638.1 DNA polymerase III subunit epsilon [Corynebacterium sanguinis]MCT2252346.1 DNA polymerase III subunit epsilon [Corynebacterium sanguinis]
MPDNFPYVAVSVVTTGIHPSTGRLLTIDAVTFDDDGAIGEEFHSVFSTGSDPGPRHNHGLEPGDFAQAPRFSRHLKTLDRLIDDRTLVLHDAPLAWGFIVSEARRAMTAAARANRSRAKRGRRRQRVGHVPRPGAIVDTLASARRQGEIPLDIRPAAVARLIGVSAEDPVASVERALRTEEDTSREQTLLLKDLFFALRERGGLAQVAPDDLVSDRFGLQRSIVRVDAENDAAVSDNPGPYTVSGGLKKGMEIVVTDDVAVDPDEIISAALDHGLSYVEKLSRQTSLVVSDAKATGTPLLGKAMHADRKGIPVLSAEQFQRAVARLD